MGKKVNAKTTGGDPFTRLGQVFARARRAKSIPCPIPDEIPVDGFEVVGTAPIHLQHLHVHTQVLEAELNALLIAVASKRAEIEMANELMNQSLQTIFPYQQKPEDRAMLLGLGPHWQVIRKIIPRNGGGLVEELFGNDGLMVNLDGLASHFGLRRGRQRQHHRPVGGDPFGGDGHHED